MVGVIGVNYRIFKTLAKNGISVFMVSQASSENNTTFVASGYSSNEVNKMVSDIESKSQTYASEQTNEKTNARQKTIGTYPNSNTTQDNAFVSMPVLFVICILFVLMLALIIFAG